MKHLNYFLFCIILLLAVACQTKLEPTIQATIPAESAETKVATPTLIPTTAPTELAAQPTDGPQPSIKSKLPRHKTRPSFSPFLRK